MFFFEAIFNQNFNLDLFDQINIVIAAVNGELTVKRLETRPLIRLVPMNKEYDPIVIPQEADLELFGVATNVIHSLRKP